MIGPRAIAAEPPHARAEVTSAPRIRWEIAEGLTPYPEAIASMEASIRAIRANEADERVWFVEHPPLYTAGSSAKPEDLQDAARFPTFAAGRGGQWTYHGPGQRLAYVMLDLDRPHGAVPARDLRAYVHGLEEWLILTLDRFNIRGERRGPRRRYRGEDRRDRRAGDALGHVAWRGREPGARARPFRGHCSVRYPRVWGDEPARARQCGKHGGAGCCLGGELGAGLRFPARARLIGWAGLEEDFLEEDGGKGRLAPADARRSDGNLGWPRRPNNLRQI
jgi:hypothetical protein